MCNLDDLKEIKEWVLIERLNKEGVVEVLAVGDFQHCRDTARRYRGDNEISLIPEEEFLVHATKLH